MLGPAEHPIQTVDQCESDSMDCRELFAKQGLRLTRQRRAIFEALACTSSHPTAEQLHEQVIDACPGLSLATVYNTLDALCEIGLCIRIPVERGSTRYDANLTRIGDGRAEMNFTVEAAPEPHLHAIDERSGEIHDVPHELGREILRSIPDEVVQRIENEMGFEVSRISLQFVGQASASPSSSNGRSHNAEHNGSPR